MSLKRSRHRPADPEFPLEGKEEANAPPPEALSHRSDEVPPEPGVSEPDEGGGASNLEGAKGRRAAEGEGGESDPDRVERLFQQAREASDAGREGEAMDLYQKLLARAPRHVRARNNLAVLLDGSGLHEPALEHLRAAQEEEPNNPEILCNMGAILAAMGRFGDAEKILRQAQKLDPSRTDVRVNLGILFFRRGLYAQADTELRWVCTKDESHAMAHFYRGEVLNRLGRVDEALEVLGRASRLQPGNPRIYYLMGILYDRKHLGREAALMYRKARELTGP